MLFHVPHGTASSITADGAQRNPWTRIPHPVLQVPHETCRIGEIPLPEVALRTTSGDAHFDPAKLYAYPGRVGCARSDDTCDGKDVARHVSMATRAFVLH
ncbi:MAG: hypothetical protein LBR08_08175 [Bacteroidales bacterium]|nr:hypothetical protein [Bacteroidales bacterium]